MTQPLKVLIVDHVHDDAELLVRQLREAGFEPEWQRVETEAEYLDRLQHGIDLVLSNHEMPQLGGFRALELLKQGGLDIPFILIGGTLCEETAVTAIKRGAADFVLKSRLTRLGTVVGQALEQTRLRRENSQARTAIRYSEQRYRTLVETTTAIVWSTPVSGEMETEQPSWAAFTGQNFDEYRGHGWLNAIHPDDQAETGRKWAEAVATRSLYKVAHRVRCRNQTYRDMMVHGVPILAEDGTTREWIGVHSDVTEAKQAELRLKLQHTLTLVLAEVTTQTEMNLKILETLCRGLHWDLGELWMVDRADKVLRCVEIWHPPSTEFKEFAGFSRPLVFAPGHGLPGCVWASGQPEWSSDVNQDVRFRRRTDTPSVGLPGWVGFPIKIRNETLGVLGFFSVEMSRPDVDMLAMLGTLGAQIGIFIERRQLAEQFRQAQKLEAVGTLAGGIAHDFNNILGAIIGYAELTKLQVRGIPAANEFLDSVLEGAQRAVDLVRQILTFSRQEQQQARVAVQLRHIVAEALKLLRASIPSSIEFEFECGLANDLPGVLADATQIHQLVMNLGTNAWHAMKDRPGRLTVRLESFTVDGQLAATQPELQPGPYVRLSVSDTGHGMDRATSVRIFDPFFTTKAPGEGTGLGLAVVRGIMQSHDGAIVVQTEPGMGTTFRLYFPAIASEAIEAKILAPTVPQGHGERILFVDDEVSLALLGRAMLGQLGYVVTTGSNVTEALALVSNDPVAFDLVITDLTMPGMTGTEFARQLGRIRPDLPVLLTTGYSASLTADRVRSLGIREMLLKPLTLQSLGSAVHRVLAEKPQTDYVPPPAH